MLNNLIIFNENDGYQTAVGKYISTLEKGFNQSNNLIFMLPDRNEILAQNLEKHFHGYLNEILFDGNEHGNDLLTYLHNTTAPKIGNKIFLDGGGTPDVFIMFKPDIIQLYFLKHFLEKSKIKLHLFLSSSDYNSAFFGDWIPYMNFRITEF